MEDQVSQNAEIARRAWDDLTQAEQAGALSDLGKYLLGRHPAWSQEAAATAMLYGLLYGMEARRSLPASPIDWGALSEVELAGRLVEVAAWAVEGMPPQQAYLRESCVEVADDLLRCRRIQREGRERKRHAGC